MKQKIIFYFAISTFLIGCSKNNEIKEFSEDKNLEINLSIKSYNSYSASLTYSYNPEIKNVNLIWGTSENVNSNNNLGELNISDNNSEITIYNLVQNTTYYFKITGIFNDSEIYSTVVTFTTSEMKIAINSQILNSVVVQSLSKIIKVSDGFIIGNTENAPNTYLGLRISKIDNQFNRVWSFKFDELEINDLYEIVDLEDGNFIAICYTSNGSGIGKIFAIKFDYDGNQIWKKFYPYSDWQSSLANFNVYRNDIKIMALVSKIGEQYFYREFSIDKDGNITNDRVFNVENNFYFYDLTYNALGEKYDVGSLFVPGQLDQEAMISKYDTENNLLWSKHYGEFGTDVFEVFLNDNNSLITAGFNEHRIGPGNYDTYRWIHFADNLGDKIWDFEETRTEFLYQAKDLKKDSDGNILALFLDIYYDAQYYDIASLLKFDTSGNLLWKFMDGEDYNNDSFRPYNVFSVNNEYLIFGITESKLWLKKILIE